MAFTRKYNKERWGKARNLQKLYEEKTGKSSSLRDFWKNDNLITQDVKKYEITIEMNYQGQPHKFFIPEESYEFFIPQESYEIYSYGSSLSISEIEEMNKQAISSIFKGKSQSWIYDHVDVQVRGIESTKAKYSAINIDELMTSNTYTTNIPKIEVGKKSKSGSTTKNSYDLNIWL